MLSQRWGTLILYGVKPRTGFYALQFSFQHGYPEFELVPLEDVALMDEGGLAPESTAAPVHATAPMRRQDIRADFFDTVRQAIVGPTKREVPA